MSEPIGGRTALKATLALASVAALLALSAAAVGYVRHGELDIRPVGGGLFMLALAIGSWSRLRGDPVPP